MKKPHPPVINWIRVAVTVTVLVAATVLSKPVVTVCCTAQAAASTAAEPAEPLRLLLLPMPMWWSG
ncbi:hypothetical protein [Actinoallomurus sp. NPDC052274]|uniref:hypothetical protein n=1 Tax=Actinoallomurus sp. NPDC052274 TaxID=3155420 RepID=UPI00344AA22C